MGWMLHDGRVLSVPLNFTDKNGDLQSGKLLSDPKMKDKRAELGIREFVEERIPYGYVSDGLTDTDDGTTVTRTHKKTQRWTVEDLKAMKVAESNERVRLALQPTDELYLRQLRGGKPVPAEVSTLNEETYAKNVREEAAISEMSDYDILLAYGGEPEPETEEGTEY